MRRGYAGLAFVLTVLSASAAPAETVRVEVDRLTFTPAEISVKVGDTVEWVNKDILAHTATVRGDWDVALPANKSGSRTMTKAGSVEYYCRFHPNMKGRIVVAP